MSTLPTLAKIEDAILSTNLPLTLTCSTVTDAGHTSASAGDVGHV
jgi:hypothetical protein